MHEGEISDEKIEKRLKLERDYYQSGYNDAVETVCENFEVKKERVKAIADKVYRKTCYHCGKTIHYDLKECSECGKSLDPEKDSQANAADAADIPSMKKFKSVATNTEGKKCAGIFEAIDKNDAMRKLKDGKYEVTLLEEVRDDADEADFRKTYLSENPPEKEG